MPIIRREWPTGGIAGSGWTSTARPATPMPERDAVDEAGDESFPCSDPPSWTTGLSTAAPAEMGDAPAPRGSYSTTMSPIAPFCP